MTIVYCDWATGNDTTGDGSAGNPYKTITKASTGLTGGDEVRVAKSPEPTALTGTLGFTNNSTAVTGSTTARKSRSHQATRSSSTSAQNCLAWRNRGEYETALALGLGG